MFHVGSINETELPEVFKGRLGIGIEDPEDPIAKEVRILATYFAGLRMLLPDLKGDYKALLEIRRGCWRARFRTLELFAGTGELEIHLSHNILEKVETREEDEAYREEVHAILTSMFRGLIILNTSIRFSG
ncbi:MAG: hypothetical protein KKA90_03530 [Nanoarchaeota archaeon]|nr:hypothetical protein [Nanoarchaeota archaeon]